jgi:hypothetical protein
VLASINQVLAEHGVNVEGQLLRTRAEYGYVLTDIGSENGEDVLAQLNRSPSRSTSPHCSEHATLSM